MKKLIGLLVAGITLLSAALGYADTATSSPNILTSFDFSVVGLGLNASPDYQAVPKGIASRVDTNFDAGTFNAADIIAQLPADYTVRAELSGPAFQTPLALVTKPGKPFDLPSLAILGKYTLSNIRLVDGAGNTLFGAAPQAVAIESIPDPLITSVTTRPLSLQEIKDRGVTFDSSNFSAYQFTAGFATQSGQIQLNLPVVIPTSAVVNNPPESVSAPPVIDLPPVPEVPQVELPQNLTVSPFLMQVEEKEAVSKFTLPPIPGIVVIPGNIGFLHQYFSALALVTNGAPLQSDLTISDVQAKIVLPAGADLTPGTDATPGDDPLRMAKGASGFFPRQLPVLNPGPDGKNGTADDVVQLRPAESGQADFTIEGLKEGTHKLDFEITATLNGLPIGPVTLKGKATGAVLVRNPDFSLTFGHPSTIRSGEQYDLFVTVTNTSQVPANLVSVSLDPRAVSGAVFVEGETSDKAIESIPAGSAATVKFRLKAQRTGKVTATAFESEEVKGKFTLRTGVGELGIPLSPDSLILPYTADIPSDLLTAAMSLLGQAWSVATAPAGALPATVLPITKNIVSSRAYDLSEAGLRISLGDTKEKALEDFSFDFLGSDNANRGFDDLRRRSTQGAALNLALGAIFQKEVESVGLMNFQKSFADKVSYRPGQISVVTSSSPIRVRLTDPSGHVAGGLSVVENRREIPYGDQILLSDDGTQRSTLTLVTSLASGAYQLEVAADADASFDLGVVLPDAAGVPQQLRFAGVQLSAGATAQLTLRPGATGDYRLIVVQNGVTTSVGADSVQPIPLHGPEVVAVTQIVPGFGPGGDKHGRNLAVLYSQRVTKASAQLSANYLVDANLVTQANLQPGNRMAFLLLRDGIGPFFERTSTISGIANDAGLTLAADSRKIRTTATGPAAVVTGAVRTARGEPVPNATIRLYQKIWYPEPLTGILEERYALFSEKTTGSDGRYQFDYVLQNDDPAGPFILEAVNPATNELGSLTTGVNFHGQRLNLDIFMKARGSVSGTVRNSSGGVIAGASVLITTLNDNRSYSATSDGTGAFSVSGIGVGAFSLKAVHQASLSEGRVMGTLPDDGGSVVQDVVLYQVAAVPKGNISGKVLGPDGSTPRSGIIVIVEAPNYRNWVRTGADGSFLFSGVFAGNASITARDDASGELSVVSGIVSNGSTSVLNVILKGTGTVTGKVQRGDGKSPEGLYVIVRVNQIARVMQTDASGSFTFTGLSTGQVSIEVLDPKDFNRTVASGSVTLLSAGETANIYLYVPEKAFASGTISGTVYSRAGAPLANAELRQLVGDLAYYKFKTDAEGKYSIPNLPLGTYRLVAVSGKEIANGTATLWYDTQVKTLDLYAAGIGTVTGTTYDNADKVPTGADVTLVSTKPNEVGWLVYESRFPTVVKSDPQTGRFSFSGIYAGSLTVSTSNVFRPTPVSAGGTITTNGQVLNLELILKGQQTPGQPPVNQMGSVSGQVLLPDGSPAGADINVTANYGGGITVTTDAFGKFQFPPLIPSGNQRITAEDPVANLLWQGYVSVPAGLDVPISIKLLGRGSLAVRALNADGSPAAGTHVVVTGASYPNDSASGDTDATGTVSFSNLSEGGYAVSASGSFGRGGRGQATVATGQTAKLDVRLDPSGTVTGRFLKADGATPIGGGQVRLMHAGRVIAYATSSSDPATLGNYRMEFVPLGDFSLDGFDPITERNGVGGGRLSTDGQSATADVIVTPRGTVKGSVRNYGGTAPVAGSSINISVSGVASFSYSTISGADGSFIFAGVPAGKFTVDASDPTNGLRGQASGTLSYEGEIAQAEVHIAPTGSIEGRLLMPDGVTPASSGTVSIAGGSGMQIEPGTGAFRFTNLAAGRSYTLNGSETNTLRLGSTIATVSRDGETAVADIVLRGIGSVQGTVFDTDGSTGLPGAVVRLSGAGVSYTDYTDENGGYHFVNVPMGAFSLQVSHPQRVTAASASGTVGHEAETVTVNLTIGPVASVTGRVLLADGVTPARGGGVSFSGSRGTFTGITDSNGVFVFANIPVPCSFSVYVEDAQGLGIGRASGSLTVNGETKDLGSIVLDDKPITVSSVDPSDGSVNVPVNRAIKVLFSEAADAATLTSSNIYLMQGASRVSGTLSADADRKGATFTPAANLSGFTLYTLVVSTGVKDLVGRSLPQTVTTSFTTIDNIPPSALSISPAGGTVEVASDAVVRVNFSETIDPSSTGGVKLTLGGVEVPTRLDLIQGGTVAVLTPLAPLNYNATYSVSVSGVRDSVGNQMQGSLQGSFNTLDTIIPTVTALTLPANTDLIKGNNILVTAQVADSDVALVDFYVNDVKKATVTSAPYILVQNLAATGTLHLKAVAQDKVGNRGLPNSLDLAIAEDQVPSARFVGPVAGSSVNTGAGFLVSVQGSDDLNLKEFVLTATGEINATQTVAASGKNPSGSFLLNAPTGITGNGVINLSLVAKDSGGNASAPVQQTLNLHDSIAPSIALASPGQTVKYKPGETAQVGISSSDNVGLASISCSASDAASATQLFTVDPVVKNTSQSFSFAVPGDAAPYASIKVSCAALDGAGNSATSLITLTVADVVAPTLVSAQPADQANNVAANAAVTLNFSETLSAASVTSSSVSLAEEGGAAVAASVSLSGDRKSIVVKPSTALKAATGYLVSVGGIADDAGNLLAAPYQLHFTTDGSAPQVASVTPAADSANIPLGASVTVRFNEPIDPASVSADLVSLTSPSGPAAGTVSVAADKLSFTFKPLNQLGYLRLYTFTLNAGVRDVSGNAMSSGFSASFTTQGPDSDLVGYWPMDGDWKDASGKGHNGSASGALFTTDHVVGTQAGSFKASGDYVSVGSLYGSFPNNSFTIESWVKLSDTGAGGRRTIAGGVGSYADYAIGLNGNQFTAYVFNGSTGYYASGVTPTLNTWYHVAGTFNGSRLKLYVNGELISDVPAGWYQTGLDFRIGNEACCGNDVNGLIDDVGVYKRALAPEDLFEHYNAGLTTNRISPNAPTVEPVASSTYNSQILLRGTKDAGTSIRVNGIQVVAHDANTTWQALYNVALGQNLLDITSRDIAGNASIATSIAVNRLAANPGDPTPVKPTLTLVSPGQGVRYPAGAPGSATVTVTSTEAITNLWCNAAGAASEGTLAIAPGGSQNQLSQEFGFTVAADAKPSAPLHLYCVAQGVSGGYGSATLDLLAADQVAPQAAITGPAQGSSVNTGTPFTVSVQASDESELKELTLTVSGEMSYQETKQISSGKAYSTSFNLTAPTVISGDAAILLSVTAKDAVGNLSQPATRTLVLHDGIIPAVTLTSPGQSVFYKPGETAVINLIVDDNMGASQIVCSAYGAATAAQSFDVEPAPREAMIFTIPVPAGALPYAVFTASCTAYDMAGNNSTANLNLTVADVVPPTVLFTSPSEGASVATNASFLVGFSETINAATVTSGNFSVTETATGASVAAAVTLSNDRKTVTVKPAAPLTRGTGYTLSVASAVADDAGNMLAQPYQVRFAGDNTAPSVVSVTPAAGSVNVAVASSVSVTFNEQIDPASVSAASLVLTSASGSVPGTVSLSSDGFSVTFKPYNQLGFARPYTVTVPAGLRDVSGNATGSDWTASFTTQSPDSDLVGYWPMDGDWSDYSGNGNNGTSFNGALFTSDHVVGTQAGSFDGVNDYVEVKNASSLNPANITVETWVKSGQATWNSHGSLLSKRDAYILHPIQDSKEIRFYVMIAGTWQSASCLDQSLDLTKWHHYVGTYDGQAVRIYVDGVLKGSTPYAGSVSTTDTGSLYIGWDDGQSARYFKGSQDDVKIYKRALLSEDIVEHYNAGLTADRTAPGAPTVDPVVAETYNNQIVLRGTKDAGSSVRVNGKQVVAHDANSTWQAVYNLNLGQNLLDVSSHDLAGNVSPSVSVVVNLLPSIASNPDVIGLWHMDGDWLDASGAANTGSAANGVTFGNGRVAGTQAGSFDGVNDSVSAKNNYLSPANTFTMAFWASPSATRNVTSESNGGVSGTSAQRYAIAPNNLGGIGAAGAGVSVGTNGISVFEHTSNYLPSPLVYNATISGWNHVTVVYENKQPRLYLNGQLVRTGIASTQTVYPSALFGDIGGYGPYAGLLNDVVIYKRVLTAQEISTLAAYQYPAAPKVSVSVANPSVKVNPGAAGVATVTATAPGGISKLSCNVSGAASQGTLVVPFDPPQTDITQQIDFLVAADAAPYAPYRVSCVAEAAAGRLGSGYLDLQAADVVPPTVAGSSIANNATGVIATTSVSVTFNEAMLGSSITGDTVQLRRADTGAVVAGTSVLSSDGKTLTFTPNSALDCATNYQFVIQGVDDLAGNSIDYGINFATQPLTSPLIQNVGTAAAPYVLAAGRYGTLTVKNSFVQLDGKVAADSMTVSSNSTLTHKPTGATGFERLDLEVMGALSIEAGSKIDVTSRGYYGGRQGNNNTDSGITNGNTTSGGSANATGGGYGGVGGGSAWGSAGNGSYGSVLLPADPGSGGSGSSASGNGGGVIKVSAGTLTLNGNLLADGGVAYSGTNYSGGGSGGSILIKAGTLSGTGGVYARGGATTYNYDGGAGAGGRIAIYYDTMSLPLANVVASGGKSGNGTSSTGHNGGAGTIYLKDNAKSAGDLVITNSGVTTTLATPVPGGSYGLLDVKAGARLEVSGNTTLNDLSVNAGIVYHNGALSIGGGVTLDAGSLTVSGTVTVAGAALLKNGAFLSHYGASTTAQYYLDLTADSVTVDATSKIDVTGRGFLGGRQGANSTDTGMTNGNTTSGGSTNAAGGSYGGLGGASAWGATVNASYGSLTLPSSLGSGGSGSSPSGNGGGMVKLTANSLTLNGSIVADGGVASGGTNYSGGGSGGSILVKAGTLTGSGGMYARGGATTYNYDGGAGGGGRIAVYYDNMTLPTANLVASGARSGNGSSTGHNGAAGTVYLKDNAKSLGDVILNNGGVATYSSTPVAGASFGSVDVKGAARVDVAGATAADNLTLDACTTTVTGAINLTGSLTLKNGSVLSSAGTSTAAVYKLDITANSVNVDATSKIDVTGKGYLGGRQGGNNTDAGMTNGNTTSGGSSNAAGGSYGGLGGASAWANTVNGAYGSLLLPNDVGSGGSGSSASGNGGGAVKLSAASLVLNGSIVADGAVAYSGSNYSGGGSGGSVLLQVGAISGAGTVYARGGATTYNYDGGAGGGGRIAIYYDTMTLPVANLLASGARSGNGTSTSHNGGVGSIYLKGSGNVHGSLIYDNGGVSCTASTTVPSGDYLTLAVKNGAQVTMNGTYNLDQDMALTSTGMTVTGTLSVPNLTLTGSTLAVNGSLKVAGAATLQSGSTLTHSGATTTASYLLDLNASSVTIDATSKIDVSGRGYLGGWQNGNNTDVGRTLNNTLTGGSAYINGGSYGGLGAVGSSGGAANAIYGLPQSPNDLGSGGGANGSSWPGGNGGGLVKVTAGTLTLAGNILADGGSAGASGGGSGGGILLNVGTLTGTGGIYARGGVSTYGSSSYGGGGGGRIAIYYDTLSLPTANILASGAKGNDGNTSSRNGGAGTIYLKANAKSDADIYLTNAGLATAYTTPVVGSRYGLADLRGNALVNFSEALTASDLVLDSAQVTTSATVTLAGNLSMNKSSLTVRDALSVAGTALLQNSSTLSHHGATTSTTSKLEMVASTVTIDATSRIDVSGKGYLGGWQNGNNTDTGRTLNNTLTGGSGYINGGSYAGLGAIGTSGGVVNAAYGLPQSPNDLGSGGGANGSSWPGGNGGGLLKLTAGTLNLSGSILADGGSAGASGGGSGGAIFLNVGTLSGTGGVYARGGAATYGSSSYGGGGGGRIAILYETSSLPSANIQVNGGKGNDGNTTSRNGGAGTIFLKGNADSKGQLIVSNGGLVSTNTTAVPAGDHKQVDLKGGATVALGGALSAGDLSLDTVQVSAATNVNVAGNLTLTKSSLTVKDPLVVGGAVALQNASVLTHQLATTTSQAKLDLQAATVSVDATSKIDVSGKGYLGGWQNGNNTDVGRTLNNTLTGGSSYINGGSYGGLGAIGTSGGSANATYGLPQSPSDLGSGGGANGSSWPGGNGGGLVKITAGTFSLSGSILADGGSAGASGGGSGGAIQLNVGALTGAGTIYARGGAATYGSSSYGGGGGGRIALYYDSSTIPTTNMLAAGGKGNDGLTTSRNGGAGTIYLKKSSDSKADLIVNNGGLITTRSTPVPGGDYRIFDVIGGALSTAGGPITSENDTVIKDTQLSITGDYTVPRNLTLTNSTLKVAGKVTIPGNLLATNSTLSLRNNLNVTGTISAQTGSLLTHEAATSTEIYKLAIQSGAISVDATSKIDVSGKGYLGGWQADNATPLGKTLAALGDTGSAALNGGSYGGLGGFLATAVGSAGYGNLFDPKEAGSGGGGGLISGTGGNGGGYLRISAPSLALNGSLRADGGDSLFGGGSGGAIRLDVAAISGSGSISARGGAGGTAGDDGNGGGGGRIALYYTTSTLPAANIAASGGKGFDGSNPQRNGGAGTLFTKTGTATYGDLTIDNRGLDCRDGSTELKSLGRGTIAIITDTSLSGSGVNWLPSSLTGLRVNPNVNQQGFLSILDNTVDTLSVDPAGGNLNSFAAVGDSFSGIFVLNKAQLLGKARVLCGEQIKVINDLLIDASALQATDVFTGSTTLANGGVVSAP